METLKNWFIGILVVVVAVLGTLTVNKSVGGSSTQHYFNETFLAGITVGGTNFATSSVGTVTYTAATFNNPELSLITHTAASALTASLPASSTLRALVPNIGDRKTILLNAVTSNITLAGGTGTILNSASSTKVILAGETARLDFVRKANTDIDVLMVTGTY